MKNIINKQNLEKLLMSKWTTFMDSKQVIAFTLLTVRNQKDSFQIVQEEENLPEKNIQITISRFEPCPEHFTVWIDFTVPHENEIVVGTVETKLKLNGDLNLLNIVGTRFVSSNNI